MSQPDLVQHHYNNPRLYQDILARLKEQGKDIRALAVDDLIQLDQFHLRGRFATESLASLINFQPNWLVLDIGCGIGGTTRFIAERYQCSTIGIDMSKTYINTAHLLTQHLLSDLPTRFIVANGMSLPFRTGSTDLIWTEHVQMNIHDKTRFYREIFNTLKPQGKLVIHEVFASDSHNNTNSNTNNNTNSSDLPYPLPWATDESINHLITFDALHHLLTEIGFQRYYWQDESSPTLSWLTRHQSKRLSKETPPRTNLLLGDNAVQKTDNVQTAIAASKLSVIQAIFVKS